MAVYARDPGKVIHEGLDNYLVWTLRKKDGTVEDFTGWSATFEIFDINHISRYRYESSGGLINVGKWSGSTIYGDFNVYLGLPADMTQPPAMEDWGMGYFCCDIGDVMGHWSYRIKGPIAYERGSTHG